MKKHYLTYIGGLAAVIALGAWMSAPAELEFVDLADAADGSQTVSVTCDAASLAAHVPNVQYTLSFPASVNSVFDATKIGVVSSLNGSGINGDAAPTVSKGEDVAGFVTIRHAAPLTKMSGLQCQSVNSYAKLDVRGTDASDNIDIAAEDTTATQWQALNQIDNAAKTLFGFNGLISASHLQDGADHDTSANGEIVFGGSTGGGRHALFSKVKYMGTDHTNSSVVLTYSFMPQAN